MKSMFENELPPPPKVDRIWGLYGDNGKENGKYYLGFRVWDITPPK